MFCLPIKERKQCKLSYPLQLRLPGCSSSFFGSMLNPVDISFLSLLTVSRCDVKVTQTQTFHFLPQRTSHHYFPITVV